MKGRQIGTLHIGDRVALSGSSIDAIGVIVAEVDEDYLRVRWDNSAISTTHRRHALHPVTSFARLWPSLFLA
jgi:hypothetical protein